jgi:hypothetical protein
MADGNVICACIGNGWGRDSASRTHPSNAREGRMEVTR